MRAIIAQLAEQFDNVIIDAPPIVGLSDVSVLSTMVDGILMVVSLAQTMRPQFAHSLRVLHQIGAPLLGFVLNKVEMSHNSYYYVYDYYAHDDLDGTETSTRQRRRHKHRDPQNPSSN